MAGLVVCDKCGEGKFVTAVASVQGMKRERSAVSPLRRRDTCADHLLETVETVWRLCHKDVNFIEVVIIPIRKEML